MAFSSWHSGLAWSDFIVFLSAVSNLLTGESDSFLQPNIFSSKKLFCLFQPGDSLTKCKHNNCNYGYCTCLTDAEKLTNISLSELLDEFMQQQHKSFFASCCVTLAVIVQFCCDCLGARLPTLWTGSAVLTAGNVASSCWLVLPLPHANSICQTEPCKRPVPWVMHFKWGARPLFVPSLPPRLINFPLIDKQWAPAAAMRGGWLAELDTWCSRPVIRRSAGMRWSHERCRLGDGHWKVFCKCVSVSLHFYNSYLVVYLVLAH